MMPPVETKRKSRKILGASREVGMLEGGEGWD